MIVMFKYVTFHWDEPLATKEEMVFFGAEVDRLGIDEFTRQYPLRFESSGQARPVIRPKDRPPISMREKGWLILFLALAVGVCFLFPFVVPPIVFIILVGGATALYARWKYRRWLWRCHRAFQDANGVARVDADYKIPHPKSIIEIRRITRIVSNLILKVCIVAVVASVCFIGAIGIVIYITKSSADSSGITSPANPLDSAIERAAQESKAAIEAKKERDSERERSEMDSAKIDAKLADIDRVIASQQIAPQSTPERSLDKMYSDQREAAYLRWKDSKIAAMREAPSTLRPEQVQAWRKAMDKWNKLTPAEKEERFRMEYRRTPEAAIFDQK